jgi:hypothetical protein
MRSLFYLALSGVIAEEYFVNKWKGRFISTKDDLAAVIDHNTIKDPTRPIVIAYFGGHYNDDPSLPEAQKYEFWCNHCADYFPKFEKVMLTSDYLPPTGNILYIAVDLTQGETSDLWKSDGRKLGEDDSQETSDRNNNYHRNNYHKNYHRNNRNNYHQNKFPDMPEPEQHTYPAPQQQNYDLGAPQQAATGPAWKPKSYSLGDIEAVPYFRILYNKDNMMKGFGGSNEDVTTRLMEDIKWTLHKEKQAQAKLEGVKDYNDIKFPLPDSESDDSESEQVRYYGNVCTQFSEDTIQV